VAETGRRLTALAISWTLIDNPRTGPGDRELPRPSRGLRRPATSAGRPGGDPAVTRKLQWTDAHSAAMSLDPAAARRRFPAFDQWWAEVEKRAGKAFVADRLPTACFFSVARSCSSRARSTVTMHCNVPRNNALAAVTPTTTDAAQLWAITRDMDGVEHRANRGGARGHGRVHWRCGPLADRTASPGREASTSPSA
jgi:hypothetical protein